jgi:hypothetical protein
MMKLLASRYLIGTAALVAGAAGAELAPVALSSIRQAVNAPCVSIVSTGGSPYRVLTPEGEEVSTHAQQHTATASATSEAFTRPGETFRVTRILELRVEVNPACVPATPDTTTPPDTTALAPLPPDSFVVLRDTIDMEVGDTVQVPLVAWWTIPQEPELGSRPFICFGGEYGLPSTALPPLEGWYEVTFPGGYPETTTWVVPEGGHSFTGDAPCIVGELVALPGPGA